MVKIFIGGDREWDDYAFIDGLMRQIRSDASAATRLLFMSGGARGVDSMVKTVCMERVWPFCEFPAPWAGLGGPAGAIRNGWAVTFGQPDVMYAVHDDLYGKSRGTKNMVKKCLKAGVLVRLANRSVGYYGTINEAALKN